MTVNHHYYPDYCRDCPARIHLLRLARLRTVRRMRRTIDRAIARMITEHG